MEYGFTFVEADDSVELAHQRYRIAKTRERDGDLALRDEADACGWSSAVVERGLALRRRRGSAPCSCRRGLVLDAADEQGCRGNEAVASVADEQGFRVKDVAPSAALEVRAESAVTAEPMFDSGIAFFCLTVL